MTLYQRRLLKEMQMQTDKLNRQAGLKRTAKEWAVKIGTSVITWAFVLGFVIALFFVL